MKKYIDTFIDTLTYYIYTLIQSYDSFS